MLIKSTIFFRFERQAVFPKLLCANAEDFSLANTAFNRDAVKAGTGRRYDFTSFLSYVTFLKQNLNCQFLSRKCACLFWTLLCTRSYFFRGASCWLEHQKAEYLEEKSRDEDVLHPFYGEGLVHPAEFYPKIISTTSVWAASKSFTGDFCQFSKMIWLVKFTKSNVGNIVVFY